HVQGPGAEVLATAAAGAVLCVGDLPPGDALVRQRADAAAEEALAAPQAATAGARGPPRGTADAGDQVGEHGLCPRGDGGSVTVCRGRRPYLSRAKGFTLARP